ncbi:hypothetical protein Aduo_015838 [Ancylostoma duodenale]
MFFVEKFCKLASVYTCWRFRQSASASIELRSAPNPRRFSPPIPLDLLNA